MELMLDEEPVVHEAALVNLIDLLDFFDADTRTSLFIPTWKKMCEDKIGRMPLLVSKHFGSYLYGCRSKTGSNSRRTN